MFAAFLKLFPVYLFIIPGMICFALAKSGRIPELQAIMIGADGHVTKEAQGAFPLMESDEMNFSILNNAFSSLKPGGKFIFTTLNGLFPLFNSVKEFIKKGESQGQSSGNTFDLMTFRDHSVYETEDDLGNKKILNCNERYYVPSEITWLLKSAGFRKSEIFGCKLGAFNRNDILSTDDFEMLVVAEK